MDSESERVGVTVPQGLPEEEGVRRGVLLGDSVPEVDPVAEGQLEGDLDVKGELLEEGQGEGVLATTVGVEAFMGEGESLGVKVGVGVVDPHTLPDTVPNREGLSTGEGLFFPLPLGGRVREAKAVAVVDRVEEEEVSSDRVPQVVGVGAPETEVPGLALRDTPGLALSLKVMEGVTLVEAQGEGGLEGVKVALLVLQGVVLLEAVLDTVCEAHPLTEAVSEGVREADTEGVPVTAPGLPDPLAVPFSPLGDTVEETTGVVDADLKGLPVRVTEMDWDGVGRSDLEAPPL